MAEPAKIVVAGHNIRDKNWGAITKAMEQSAAGQSREWFDRHSLQLIWIDTPAPNPGPAPDQTNQILLALHNQYRAQAGLPPFQLDDKLIVIAGAHSLFMASTGNFDHDQPGNPFSNRIKNAGVAYRSAGENIALSYPDPQAVLKGWMNSPGHKANILSTKFNRVGFGLARSASGRLYWTTDFIQSLTPGMAALVLGEMEILTPGGLINPGSATVIEIPPE